MKGAHLQPLGKNDHLGGPSTQKWNQPAAESTQQVKQQNQPRQQNNTTDLLELWKRTTENKLDFLQNTGEKARRVCECFEKCVNTGEILVIYIYFIQNFNAFFISQHSTRTARGLFRRAGERYSEKFRTYL